MATWIYCLLPRLADASALRRVAPSSLAGVGGARVRILDHGEIDAWVSDVGPRASSDAEDRLAHAGVIQFALDEGVTPLPARVGQIFASDDALRADLASRAPEIAATLERLRGKVEMTLMIHRSSEDATEAGELPGAGGSTGRAYLERIRAEMGERDREREIGEGLRSQAREALKDLVDTDSLTVIAGARRYIIAHLVRRDTVDEWRRRASELVLGSGRTFIAGPIAPYSFTSVISPDRERVQSVAT